VAECPFCEGDYQVTESSRATAPHDRACPGRAHAPPPRRQLPAANGNGRHAWPGGPGDLADRAGLEQRRREWAEAFDAAHSGQLL
jgi:hypothetical protein